MMPTTITELSSANWDEIESGFSEPKTVAAEIAKCPSISATSVEQKLKAGIRAALNGVSAKEMELLRSVDNLDKLLGLCAKCREQCILRIGKLPDPRSSDVEWIHTLVQLRVDEGAGPSIRGEAIEELERRHRDLYNRVISILRGYLGRTVEASGYQVTKAFSGAMEYLVGQSALGRGWWMAFQVIGLFCLGSYGIALKWDYNVVGAVMCTAGVLINVINLFRMGQKL